MDLALLVFVIATIGFIFKVSVAYFITAFVASKAYPFPLNFDKKANPTSI
jgi:hypothetical protein